MSKTVGVVLSGCGFLDGAEIHESVLTLLHLDRAGANVVCMAPRIDQHHVVDHATGEVAAGETRSVFSEAARIARGKLRDLAEVRAEELDALILPGGFGAAKNLSDFAFAGADARVHPALAELLRGMLAAGKPIGVVCISPAVLAAALRGTEVGATLTLGAAGDAAAAVEQMGAHHVECPVTGFAVDERHKIVSTPAYMYDARIADVAAGVEKLVQSVMALA